jgi:hypothetical protein
MFLLCLQRSCIASSGLLFLLASCAIPHPELGLPERSTSALRGSELRAQLLGKSLMERERLVMHELTTGNVPAHLRRMVPVSFEAVVKGKARTATIWCTPDYLGVGEDTDWFRMPLTPQSAQGIADRLDCVLPTRRMVDAIWRQAAVQLEPAPFSPKHYDITSVATFYLSHSQIELQLGARQGPLVAGIKKDVVISALIGSWPKRVRDLWLALPERQGDPASLQGASHELRRLQPRHPAGRAALSRGWRPKHGGCRARRPRAARPAQ